MATMPFRLMIPVGTEDEAGIVLADVGGSRCSSMLRRARISRQRRG